MGPTRCCLLEEEVNGAWLKAEHPEDWEGIVSRFYTNLFEGPSREALERQAAEIRKAGLARRLVGGLPEAEVSDLRLFRIQQATKQNKAGHPEEHLVPNIIVELPVDIIKRLAQLFAYRSRGLQQEPANWKRIWMHCIGKSVDP